MTTKTALVTGCSDGGLGAALCLALKDKGFRVIATARNPKKMGAVQAAGIECLTLDITSAESLEACVASVKQLTDGTLDMLINNAGRDYMMPFLDIDLDQMRAVFETNVYSYVTVTRGFFPLLVQSTHEPLIVNNTSVCSHLPLPFDGAYNASKAAAAMLSMQMRIELHDFGIKVVDLKTAAVQSNIWTFDPNDATRLLPPDSVYEPVRKRLEKSIFQGEDAADGSMPAAKWAAQVVKEITKSNASLNVWKGGRAWKCWLLSLLPAGFADDQYRKMFDLGSMTQQVALAMKKNGS